VMSTRQANNYAPVPSAQALAKATESMVWAMQRPG